MIFDLHNDIYSATNQPISDFISSVENLYGCIGVDWTSRKNGLISFEQKINAEKIYYAIEDLHFYTKKEQDVILKLNPLYCSLTWNDENALAGGAFSDGDLTKIGKRVIDFLNDNDICIDLAHLNKRSFYSVVERSRKVIVSHTGVYELKNHRRNIDLLQAKLITQKQGLIGLTPVTFFMKGETVRDFAETIDFLVDKIGESQVAIGTDFNGSTDFPNGLTSYFDFNKVRYYLENLGYKSTAIDDIFFKNAMRYFDIK